MLNKLLERLPLLLSEGIDYKATRDAMQKAQEESRHLWQFAREVGLEVQSGGRVWVKDLWEELQNWYENAGILEREYDGKGKDKLIWHELSNKYDAPVKAINQVPSRFTEIFPKLQLCRYCEREEIQRRGQRYLLGIGFVQGSVKTVKTADPSDPVDIARDIADPTADPKNIGSAVGSAQTFTQSRGSDGSAISSRFAELCNLLSQLTNDERQKLVELLTQSQPLPEKVTPEDAQIMRDIALIWWSEYYPERIQALVTQMYGWQAPGTKYDVATIAEWLQGEDDLVRDRITELMYRRRG